jgi:glycosyltransferase involved in cell wall biosynthesis
MRESNKKLVSVIIRTLNEERYLEELLMKISIQDRTTYDVEVVIVDSGSTDSTLDVAKKWKARITHISKDDFSFGRSLNIGCEFSK